MAEEKEKEISFSEAMDGIAHFKNTFRWAEKIESVLLAASRAEGQVKSQESEIRDAEKKRDEALEAAKVAIQTKDDAELDLKTFQEKVIKEKKAALDDMGAEIESKQKLYDSRMDELEKEVEDRKAEIQTTINELVRQQQADQAAHDKWVADAQNVEAEYKRRIADLEGRLRALGSGVLNAIGG